MKKTKCNLSKTEQLTINDEAVKWNVSNFF